MPELDYLIVTRLFHLFKSVSDCPDPIEVFARQVIEQREIFNISAREARLMWHAFSKALERVPQP